METKVDQMMAVLAKRHQEREDTAQQYKRYVACCDANVLMCVLSTLAACVSSLCMIIGCSVLEQKVDQMEAELTRRQQEREESAQQIKRCVHNQWT